MARLGSPTPSTPQNMFFDAGMLFEDLDYSTATDADSLFALLVAAIDDGSCFGATRGGINFSSAAEYGAIEHDDIFYDLKGSKIKGKVTVSITSTLVEFTEDNLGRIVNAADVEVINGIPTLTERTSIDTEKDYIDHIVCAVRQGDNDWAIIELDNCINLAEFSIQTNNEGQAETPLNLVASVDTAGATHAPYRIKWFRKAV